MSRYLTTLFVLLLVLAGSLFFFFQSDPEHQVLVSPDGFFRAEVRDLSGGATFTIEQENGSASTARVSPLYQIDVEGVTGGSGFEIALSSPLASYGHTLARWNEDAWEVVPTSMVDGRFVARGPSGVWALLQSQDIAVDSWSPKSDQPLSSFAPSRAEFGVMTVAYSLAEDDYVSMPSWRSVMMCEGGSDPDGLILEQKEVIDQVILEINGVKRKGSMRTRFDWYLSTDGCPLDRPLILETVL